MTHSQAVALPDRRPHALQMLQEAYAAIAETETPDEAVQIADQTRVIAAALRAGDHGLELQNEAAALRITAERRIGLLIGTPDDADWTGVRMSRGERVLPEGVSRDRALRARKLAKLDDHIIEEYIARMRGEEKELTLTGALKLAPTQPREERANVVASYSAPPIDVQVARELYGDVSDSVAELLVAALNDALRTMKNRKQARVWAKYHGINDDGTIGDRWLFPGIAQEMGVTREYVENLYYRGSSHVNARIAVAGLNKVQELLLAA